MTEAEKQLKGFIDKFEPFNEGYAASSGASLTRLTFQAKQSGWGDCCSNCASPVLELNRAVAVAMRDGPESGLTLIDAMLARGDLADYYLAHAARADLCRRLRRMAEARSSYERALALTRLEPERRFLEKRIRELG